MFLYKYWQVNLLVNNSYNNCVMFTLPSSGLRKRKEKQNEIKLHTAMTAQLKSYLSLKFGKK